MRISDWSSDVCSSDLDDLRALLQHHFRVLRKKPDQLLAVGFQHVGAHERALADKIRLRLADRPGEAGIIRCDRPVRVLTDDDVALLRAEHMHGLGAVRRDAELAAGFVERLPEGKYVGGGHGDLVADLDGETDTEQPSRDRKSTSLNSSH